MQALLLRAALFAALWWVLAEGRNDGWLLGALAVATATWTSLRLQPPSIGAGTPAAFARFLAFFVRSSWLGGLQVTAMALRGRAALQPGMVEWRTTLPAGGARMLLVYVVGLMPGTVGVDLNGDTLLIHALDERLPVAAETRALEDVIRQLWVRET